MVAVLLMNRKPGVVVVRAKLGCLMRPCCAAYQSGIYDRVDLA